MMGATPELNGLIHR